MHEDRSEGPTAGRALELRAVKPRAVARGARSGVLDGTITAEREAWFQAPSLPRPPCMSDADAPDETTTWPELAIGLYDRLTGRNAEITYEFDDMEVDVPSTTGEDPEYADWRIDGTLTVKTREKE